MECADGHVPISEIELELIDGSAAALYGVASEIHRIEPVRIEPLTKCERGYALAAGRSASPRRAKPIRYPDAPTAGDALEAVLRECVAHWTANEGPALDGHDPEGVHQMRVGLRRLRSALSVFAPLLPPDDIAWLKDGSRSALRALDRRASGMSSSSISSIR